FFAGKASDGVGIHDIYRTVRQCGGFLWASSELGRGSTFRILLPHAAEPLPATLALDRTLPLGSGTVLILDQDEMLRGLAARTLRDCGYRVLETANSPEALQAVQEHSGIDLLLAGLTDHEKGREVFQQISASAANTRVLFLGSEDGD